MDKELSEILRNWFYNYPVAPADFSSLVGEIADMFIDSDINFDDKKFFEDCGLDTETILFGKSRTPRQLSDGTMFLGDK